MNTKTPTTARVVIFAILGLVFLSCSQNSFKQNLEVSSESIRMIDQIDAIVINKMNEYNKIKLN